MKPLKPSPGTQRTSLLHPAFEYVPSSAHVTADYLRLKFERIRKEQAAEQAKRAQHIVQFSKVKNR